MSEAESPLKEFSPESQNTGRASGHHIQDWKRSLNSRKMRCFTHHVLYSQLKGSRGSRTSMVRGHPGSQYETVQKKKSDLYFIEIFLNVK